MDIKKIAGGESFGMAEAVRALAVQVVDLKAQLTELMMVVDALEAKGLTGNVSSGRRSTRKKAKATK